MHPRHPKLASDFGCALSLLLEPEHRLPVDPRLATLVHPIGFGLGDPSSCRSRRRLVSNSAKTASISKNAAVVVSMGWSAAFRNAPLAFNSRTMSCRSPID